MLDDHLEKGVIKLPEPKRLEELGRIADPKYYRYHRMVNHPLKKCIMIKEHIMQLAKQGRIILDLDDVAEANHVSTPIRELCTLQFGNLKLIVLFEPWLLNSNTEVRSFSTAFLDRTRVNMTSCSELKEETNEGVNKENCSRDTDKTVAALEAMVIAVQYP